MFFFMNIIPSLSDMGWLHNVRQLRIYMVHNKVNKSPLYHHFGAIDRLAEYAVLELVKLRQATF